MKTRIAAMAAALLASTVASQAQSYDSQRDPNGYYSQSDQRGYYDHNGRYRQMRFGRDRYDRQDRSGDTRYDPSANYYRQGEYEESCNGGAVIGGAVLGGLLGNTVSKDIDCDDQPYAFNTYSEGLNGEVGRRYDWNHGESRGYFQPTRDYRRSGIQCRDFTETTYRGGREFTHVGTACRASDGYWHFD
jgi:surface antigen